MLVDKIGQRKNPSVSETLIQMFRLLKSWEKPKLMTQCDSGIKSLTCP